MTAPPSSPAWLALRWPVAVVLSSALLGAVALKLLSSTIPIRIEGGLKVDRLVMPAELTIRADAPLPVQAGVTVDGDASLTGEQPIRISGPVQVQSIDAPIRVAGSVSADVPRLEQPLVIRTSEEPLEVVNEVTNSDLTVTSQVTLEQPVKIEGSVDVSGRVGAKIGL